MNETTLLTIVIPGKPEQKKSPMLRSQINAKTGKSKAFSIPDIRNALYYKVVKTAAHKAGLAPTRDPFTGHVFLEATYYFQIPQSYSKVKQKRLAGTFHVSKPDLDRLNNMIMDALTYKGERKNSKKKFEPYQIAAWKDDSQVQFGRCVKVWTEDEPYSEITLTFLPPVEESENE